MQPIINHKWTLHENLTSLLSPYIRCPYCQKHTIILRRDSGQEIVISNILKCVKRHVQRCCPSCQPFIGRDCLPDSIATRPYRSEEGRKQDSAKHQVAYWCKVTQEEAKDEHVYEGPVQCEGRNCISVKEGARCTKKQASGSQYCGSHRGDIEIHRLPNQPLNALTAIEEGRQGGCFLDFDGATIVAKQAFRKKDMLTFVSGPKLSSSWSETVDEVNLNICLGPKAFLQAFSYAAEGKGLGQHIRYAKGKETSNVGLQQVCFGGKKLCFIQATAKIARGDELVLKGQDNRIGQAMTQSGAAMDNFIDMEVVMQEGIDRHCIAITPPAFDEYKETQWDLTEASLAEERIKLGIPSFEEMTCLDSARAVHLCQLALDAIDATFFGQTLQRSLHKRGMPITVTATNKLHKQGARTIMHTEGRLRDGDVPSSPEDFKGKTRPRYLQRRPKQHGADTASNCTTAKMVQAIPLQRDRPTADMNTIFVYWDNIMVEMAAEEAEVTWVFDGYPIGLSLTKMMLHCLAHEIIHAILNACASRSAKFSTCEQHPLAFHNLIGSIFGHPWVVEEGSWRSIRLSFHTHGVSLRSAWADQLALIKTRSKKRKC